MRGTVQQAFKFFWEGLGHIGRVRTVIDVSSAILVAVVAVWAALGSLALVWAVLIGAVVFALVGFALRRLMLGEKCRHLSPGQPSSLSNSR